MKIISRESKKNIEEALTFYKEALEKGMSSLSDDYQERWQKSLKDFINFGEELNQLLFLSKLIIE